MTPREMHEMLVRMQAQAAKVPGALAVTAAQTAKTLNATPGVRAASSATETGAVLRVVSGNRRLPAREVARRVRPALVKAADRAIRGVLRA